MITENFDYEKFANEFVGQIPALIACENLEENDIHYIEDIVREFSEKACEAIEYDKNFNINLKQAEFFCRTIAEKILRQIVILINSQIPKDFWHQTLQGIAFAVFETLKKEINNASAENKIIEEVELSVAEKWNKTLDAFEEKPVEYSESDFYEKKGMYFEENEKYEDAIECYLRCVELNSGQYVRLIYEQLIDCYKALDDSENVLLYCDKIIEEEPMDGYLIKGFYLYELKRYEEALICMGMTENILNKELYLLGDSTMNCVYHRMSECYKMLGDNENATTYTNKLVDID